MLRFAVDSDAQQISQIYAYYVENTWITFEESPPSAHEISLRLERASNSYPWLVVSEENDIVGFAYASHFKEQRAYRWSVTSSIYVRNEKRRMQVGKRLYIGLFSILERQKFVNCFAGIAQPNEASVKFHESFGFQKTGVFPNAGYKLGKWRDVGWWVRPLAATSSIPEEPVQISAL